MHRAASSGAALAARLVRGARASSRWSRRSPARCCRAPVGRAFLDAGVPLSARRRSSCARPARRARCSRYDARPHDERGLGDEARHDLRRARAARPRLPLEDRGLPRRAARQRHARGRPGPQGLRRPEDHDRAMAVVHGDAARAGTRRRSPATSCSTGRTSGSRRTTRPRSTASRSSPTTSAPMRCSSTSSRCASCSRPNAAGDGVDVRAEPPLPQIALGAAAAARRRRLQRLARGARRRRSSTARPPRSATFAGRYAASCGERDWYVALLDRPALRRSACSPPISARRAGSFDGGVKEGRAPRRRAAVRHAASPPLYDIVRDVNKLSNNVMARQLFLTLATTGAAAAGHRRQAPPKRCGSGSRGASSPMPGLVLENGSGLSRQRARERGRPRAPARRGRREPGARRVRELARRRRDRRHRASDASRTAPSPGRRC